MKLCEVQKEGRKALFSVGIESSRLDADLILSYVTGLSKVGLIAHDQDDLDDKRASRYFELINKRKTGYPVAYILGYKEFFGLKLKVNESTLIPRPDTETLVQAVLDLNVTGRILDMGTGSGAVILALKKELKDRIFAVACDIDDFTLDVARENANTHSLQVEFFKSDWFSDIPYHDFSVIVSNPPYIAAGDEHLDKTSLPFEPQRALTSGADGLDDIKKICSGSCNYLVKRGYLVLEHGYDQGQSVRDIMTKEGFSSVRTIKDLGGNDRVTLGQLL